LKDEAISFLVSTSPPVSPSPIKERGKKKKEGLPPLLNALFFYRTKQ